MTEPRATPPEPPSRLSGIRGAWYLHVPPWRVALAALGIGFIVVEFADWRRFGFAGLVLRSFAFVPLQVGSAIALAGAARRTDLPGRQTFAVRMLAAAFACLALGSITLGVIAVGMRVHPVYSRADPFYIAFYPLAAVALLSFPRAKRHRSGVSRMLLDALVPAAAVIGLAWALTLIPARATDPISRITAYIYPISALAALLAANVALSGGLPQPSRPAFLLIVGALAFDLLGDLLFQLATTFGYTAFNWSVPIAVVTNVMILWGAWRMQHDPLLTADRATSYTLRFSPVPLLGVGGIAAILFWVTLEGGSANVRPALVALIVLNVLLLVRDTLTIWELSDLRAVARTRATEARFLAMAQHASDLIMLVDTANVIRFASPAARTTLGCAPDALVGRRMPELLHADDAAAGAGFLDELMLQPDVTRTIRWRVRHADGSWRTFETVGTNLLGESAVEGLVLTSRDVSERERLENQLRQAQKMEAVGRLAGGVAHDFNNLLTAVFASAEFARLELPPDHPVREDIELIHQAATSAAVLTRRLLSLSRRAPVQPKVWNMGTLVTNATTLVERVLGPSIHLEVAAAPVAGPIAVDADDFEQALLNLAANARDAMPGGGTLAISVRHVELDQPLVTPFLPVNCGSYVVLEVGDTGTGMDAVTAERIFEPFFTTKDRGRGTGLGLAGVYGMVKEARGGIEVESAPGLGTTVRLYMPRAATPAPMDAIAGLVAMPGGSATILLVEDDPAVRDAAARILRAAGYTVLVAEDAAAARRLLANDAHVVDLLLTDVIMPGGSGPALAADIAKRRPGIRVLFMSGYPGDELDARGLLTGDVALLRKPFSTEQLRGAVAGVLARYTRNR